MKQFQIMGPQKNFLGIDKEARMENASAVVLPVPLELTTSFMKGTAKGPMALLKASHQVELYDDELKVETYRNGITTLSPMVFNKRDVEKAIDSIESHVMEILSWNKALAIIGGEHSLTVGAVRAYKKKFPHMSVLHLDAHADLRQAYDGSKYSHACVMARIQELCPFVSVGIRSLCKEEAHIIQENHLPVFDRHEMKKSNHWIEDSLQKLSEEVYITLDLDVLDPAIMPSVGTPEPGGMDWWELLSYLKSVFSSNRIIGFDIVELTPRNGTEIGIFAAAKLLYRLFGYYFAFKNA